jgi:hypothetical protein
MRERNYDNRVKYYSKCLYMSVHMHKLPQVRPIAARFHTVCLLVVKSRQFIPAPPLHNHAHHSSHHSLHRICTALLNLHAYIFNQSNQIRTTFVTIPYDNKTPPQHTPAITFPPTSKFLASESCSSPPFTLFFSPFVSYCCWCCC